MRTTLTIQHVTSICLGGKAIFFVNDIERCFKLKIFFERFSIKAAVLNSELPQNSRLIYF